MASLYWERHPGTGPYLLLVHGFLSSRAQWRPNLEALGACTRPVVVELWGHGRSPRPSQPAQHRPEGYLAEFEAIRRELGTERWLLCGQSLGASLTLRYCLAYPDRVIAQVFTNSNSALADAAAIRRRRADAAAAIERIEREGIEAVRGLRIHPRHARRLPAEVHAELVADADRIDPGAVADSYRHLNPDASVRERLHEIRAPSLLAQGRYERRFAALRAFAEARLPGLRVVELEAGHAVNIEAAADFNRHVSAFFRQASESAAGG